MALPTNTCKCGRPYQSTHRGMCSYCFARQSERDRCKSTKITKIKTTFKHSDDVEVAGQWMGFVRAISDMGTSGVVTHYRPGDPGFSQLAAQYGGVR